LFQLHGSLVADAVRLKPAAHFRGHLGLVAHRAEDHPAAGRLPVAGYPRREENRVVDRLAPVGHQAQVDRRPARAPALPHIS